LDPFSGGRSIFTGRINGSRLTKKIIKIIYKTIKKKEFIDEKEKENVQIY